MPTRDTVVGGSEAVEAVEGGRDAHGTADVATDTENASTHGDERAFAAARAAGGEETVAWVDGAAVEVADLRMSGKKVSAALCFFLAAGKGDVRSRH